MSEHKEQQVRKGDHEHSLGLSVALFTLLFGMFVAGLYVMSLYTINHWLFTIGLMTSIVSLFIAFELVPRFKND